MLRSQTKKTVARLSLGILFAVVLVMLPGVLSAETSNHPSTPTTNTTNTCSGYCLGPATTQISSTQAPTGRSSLSSTTMPGTSLLVIMLLIFAPSTLFSFFVRRWAVKRANNRPYE